jgi:PAS domain S-box-containing protein
MTRRLSSFIARFLPNPGRPYSLRRRLMAYLGTIGLFTVAVVCVGVFVFVSRVETASWRGRQGEAARAAAQTVAAFLQRTTDSLTLIGLLARDELERDSDLMQKALAQHPAIIEAAYLDGSGTVVADTTRERPLLAYLFTIPQSVWFQKARAGEPYYSNIQLSSLDKPYIIGAVPAPGGAVVAARLEMEVLWDVVADIRFGVTGRAYVVTGSGQIIAHTDPTVVLANANVSTVPGLQAALLAPDKEWHGGYTDLHGESVVGVTAPVPGTDWVVVTELPQAEAFASSRLALALLGSIALLCTSLVMWLNARFLGRMVLAPLEALRRGSEKIGQGDLSYRVGLVRNDEVGQVARSFDAMAASLATKTEALVAEVAERTRAEEALRLLNQELETRVADRTASLAQINEALRASEERYRVVVEDMPALVCRYLSDGVLTFVNEQYCSYFDTTPDALLGQSFFQFIPPDERQAVYEHYRSLTPDCPVKMYEHQVLAADGTIRWQQWTDRAIFDDQGQAVEYQSIGHDVTERRLVEQRIRDSLHEKEAMLKEIHHRVKNNLQIISSLLSLQSDYIDDPQAGGMFRDSQTRIHSMALIHERLYQSPDLSSIDFGRYIEALVTELFRAYGPSVETVAQEIQTDQVSLAVDRAIPCSLIVNELVSNTLKHAFPGGRSGTLDGKLQLVVADDGVGLPANFDITSSQTLGLQLVVTLTEQLDGTLAYRSGPGTEFEIVFPYDPPKAAQAATRR